MSQIRKTARLLPLAIMLMALLGSRAIAEETSFVDFFERQIVPIAARTAQTTFTADELRELLSLVDAQGVSLLEDARDTLDKKLFFDLGYSKTATMRQLVSAAYGVNRILWPVHIQKWYDDWMAALGLAEDTHLVVPEGDEISKESAVALAEAYVVKTYHEPYSLRDPNCYKRGQQYIEGGPSDAWKGRFWIIDYIPLVLEAGKYEVYIDSKGNILDVQCWSGFESGSDFHTMVQRVMNLYGDFYQLEMSKWPQEAYQMLKTAATLAGKPAANASKLADILQRTDYPDISPEAIDVEEAYLIAAQALGYSSNYAKEGAIYIEDSPHPVWKVNICDYDYVEIDSVTGEVKALYPIEEPYRDWEAMVTLKRIKDEVDLEWVPREAAQG